MIQLLHILTIVFIVLKLTGAVVFSWWIVLSPSITVFVFMISFLVIYVWASTNVWAGSSKKKTPYR